MIRQRTRECLKIGALLPFKIWNKIMAKTKAKKPKQLTKRIAAKVAKQITKQTTKDVARQIQQLYLEHLKKKLTLKELKAMLLYLIDNYALVTYKEAVLTVQTEGIFRHYSSNNYGSFNLNLHLKMLNYNECHYYILKIYPTGTRHIDSSGALCFGNGFRACEKSLQEGRIDDFVDIVQQILRT